MDVEIVRVVIWISVFFSLEVVKVIFDEGLLKAFVTFFIFSTIVVLTTPIMNVALFLALIFQIFEMVCYYVTYDGFNIMMLMTMDFEWIWNNLKSLWVLLAVICIVLYLLVSYPICQEFVVSIPFNAHFWMSVPSLIMVLYFCKALKLNLYPYPPRSIFEKPSQTLLNFFSSPIAVTKTGNAKKRNLFILEMESLEQQIMGNYNIKFKESMPYVYNMSERGTYFNRVISQPYTIWSVASTFAVHCNMPMIIPQGLNEKFQTFHLLPNHKCLGDYLSLAGYDLHSFMTNEFVGNFKNMLKIHNWNTYDKYDHGFTKDTDVVDMLVNEILPALAKNQSQRPFALHWANTDSHPTTAYVDPRCNLRVPRSYPKLLKTFDCYDQLLEKLFTKFEELGLDKTTEVIMYGDHLLMRGLAGKIRLVQPRYLPIIFPYREKRKIDKQASIYDIAPTVLDIFNLKASPEFPFGASLFSNTIGAVPTNETFQQLFDIFHRDKKFIKG